MKLKRKVTPELLREIASNIRYGIIDYYNGDCERTFGLLHHCAINDILVKSKRGKLIITIICNRPGLIIGSKGVVIDHIKEYISKNMNGTKIQIDLRESPSYLSALYPMSFEEAMEIGGW